jgi:hypothetical protein
VEHEDNQKKILPQGEVMEKEKQTLADGEIAISKWKVEEWVKSLERNTYIPWNVSSLKMQEYAAFDLKQTMDSVAKEIKACLK